MKNNNTDRRSATKGSGRRSSAEGGRSSGRRSTSSNYGRPARKYSSAEEGSDERSERAPRAPRRFEGGSDRPRSPRRFEGGSDRPRSPRRYDDKNEGGERRERSERAPRRFEGGSDRPRSPRRFEDKDENVSGRREREEGGFEREDRGSRMQSYTPKQRAPRSSVNDGVRLNKYVANSGICSRREADDYITAGVVSVNDVVINELGTKVYPNDVVKFNGERIKGEEKVYIVMNKPKDFVTTTSDPYAEDTVLSLISGKCAERVYPVGRLDKATTGVLMLTNDGEMAEKLTHPSFEKKKIYHVFLDKNLKTGDFQQILEGVNLEDGLISADALSYIDEDKSQVGIEIHSGRNRIVRRLFEHFGYKIKKLDRVYFAGLTKKNLRRGQWRFLTDQELGMLKMGAFE